MVSATPDTAVSLDHLLGTAESHATRNVPVAAPADPVDSVLSAMRGRCYDSASVVAVCDGDRLVGLATMERLLAAAPGFLPGIVYLADAVGTQTEALAIRGLSVGVGIRRVAVPEALTGLLVGVLLGVLMFPAIAILWGDVAVALAVAVAVTAASAIATVVALALPWLFHRIGGDPAFGSGPLATVIQDLLSILIYLATVAAVLP
jgi:hypothetical protein